MKALDLATRDDIANKLAERWTENADIKDLERFYFDAQIEFLSELSDEELLLFAKDYEVDHA